VTRYREIKLSHFEEAIIKHPIPHPYLLSFYFDAYHFSYSDSFPDVYAFPSLYPYHGPYSYLSLYFDHGPYAYLYHVHGPDAYPYLCVPFYHFSLSPLLGPHYDPLPHYDIYDQNFQDSLSYR
jgi:hypothetical protein